VYYDPAQPMDKRYGFHVYRPGQIFDSRLSQAGFETREAAGEIALKVSKEAHQGYEIIGAGF